MEINELTKFATEENQRLMNLFGFKTKSELIYPQMLKLMEEIGEFSECVLNKQSLQRKEKSESKKFNIENEIADVILVAILLSQNLDIDIEKALADKMKIIEDRHKN